MSTDDLRTGVIIQVSNWIYELEDCEYATKRNAMKRNRWSATISGGPNTPEAELVALAQKFAAVDDLVNACKNALEALQRDDVKVLALDPLYVATILAALAKAGAK